MPQRRGPARSHQPEAHDWRELVGKDPRKQGRLPVRSWPAQNQSRMAAWPWSNYRDCTSSPIMRPRANNHQQGTSAIHKVRCQSWRDKMNCRAHFISCVNKDRGLALKAGAQSAMSGTPRFAGQEGSPRYNNRRGQASRPDSAIDRAQARTRAGTCFVQIEIFFDLSLDRTIR